MCIPYTSAPLWIPAIRRRCSSKGRFCGTVVLACVASYMMLLFYVFCFNCILSNCDDKWNLINRKLEICDCGQSARRPSSGAPGTLLVFLGRKDSLHRWKLNAAAIRNNAQRGAFAFHIHDGRGIHPGDQTCESFTSDKTIDLNV